MKLLIAIVLTIWVANLQESPILEKAKKNLVGSSQKEWVFERVEYYLSDGQRCAEGVTYSFSESGDVIISECINEKLTKTTRNWSLELEEPKDVIVSIGDESFYLIFYKNEDDESIEHMILRNIKDFKPVENIDKIFTYIID
ncbi:hypothetical protein [Cyclobacterium marinum]|uniref:hypothetical protein n=1 Tax=Cyclobacterium marinum TaxID=104 RepID=UPI0011F0342E|nr:hypothetical protein [Cyclobacterium marinum]MBI0401132.1 hypothetical protein [Cyclobacterium marinum]